MDIPELTKPTPEELMRRLQAERSRAERARLKIFLGYAPGVGKSYRMLDEACRRQSRGEDVVVGAVQEKQSEDVQALLCKLDVLPTLEFPKGYALDVQAVLTRRPQVCVVDPLAFQNPTGSKNPYRWQDVLDLLGGGVSILTGLNLLHVEELTKKVEAVTGKRATDTVPKSFLLAADEIVIVDVPPDLALSRLGEQLTSTGISNEQERQLSELRELALLLTAEVVEAQLIHYLREHGIEPLSGMQERFLLCLTPCASAKAMIESGKRNKDRFQGELFAVYVRQPESSEEERAAIRTYLATAREAGATVEVLDSSDPTSAIVEFARHKCITQIFIGHSSRKSWQDRLFGDPVQKLIRAAEGIDVRVFPH